MTSLEQQLKALKVPHTVALVDTREKTSLLFDIKEAATKDRRTIYELGVAGLHELCAINSSFQQFEYTLFDETTIDLQRVVEQSDVNKLLDANVNKFLQHLSPYFLLRPAHLCLEWLIRRFHVHHYNTEALLALALPYHETNIFVRLVQTLPKAKVEKWLYGVRKTGITLPKNSIYNRAASERSFLNFICNHTLETVREFKDSAYLLQALLNFYTTTVVGALEHAPTVQEWHITAILPSLLKFFNSEVSDVVSAAIFVAVQLVARTQLTSKLGNSLIKRAASVKVESLRDAVVLLINWIFETQHAIPALEFTENSLSLLVRERWVTQKISDYVKQNFNMLPICSALLKQTVAAIQMGDIEASNYKMFLQRFLFDVKLSEVDGQQFISMFLDTLNTDFEGVDLEFRDWYKDYLKQLEHQYPTAFDLAVKDALNTKNTDEESMQRSDTIRMALGFCLDSSDEDEINVIEKLYHPTPEIRIIAVRTLIQHMEQFSVKTRQLHSFQQCLVHRLQDDSEAVIAETLKLKTQQFLNILDVNKFVETLRNILVKSQLNATPECNALLPQVLQHLLAPIVIEQYDTNLLMLALMPVLLPKNFDEGIEKCLKLIKTSKLTEKLPFLQHFNYKNLNSKSLKPEFLNCLTNTKKKTNPMQLYASVQQLLQQQPDYFKTSYNFVHYLLLFTVNLQQSLSVENSRSILMHMSEIVGTLRLKQADHQYWLQNEQLAHVVPLQLYCDFLMALAQHTQFGKLNEQQWMQQGLPLECFLLIYNHIVQQLLLLQKPTPEKHTWTQTLQQFLITLFPTAQDKFEFFLQFCIYNNVNCIENFAILRIITLKLLKALLQTNNNSDELNITLEHILKINCCLQTSSETLRVMALDILSILAQKQLPPNLKSFVQLLLDRREEIAMDEKQYALILFLLLKPNDNKRAKTQAMLQEIVQICCQQNLDTSALFVAETLQSLRHINDIDILLQLIPLAKVALQHVVIEDNIKLLKSPFANILQLICSRLNKQQFNELLCNHEQQAWFFAAACQQHDTYFVQTNKKPIPLPCAVLQALDNNLYDSLSAKHRYEFVKLIISILAAADNNDIYLSCITLLKNYELDCAAFVSDIENMYKFKPTANKTENCIAWKEGIVLLGLLENRKYLANVERIIPCLFELLRVCLQNDAGDGILEDRKQLILATLLNCCVHSKDLGLDLPKLLPEASFRVDQVVQCVRATKNPQTQYYALQLLIHCAEVYPKLVLNNIMEIFTFMGSTIVRNDDEFSFKIICQIIETVIPILLQATAAAKTEGDVQAATVIPMLKMFVYILFDVPEHRRLPLYCKLLETLGVADYLWMFLCILFEKETASEEEKLRSSEKVAARSKYMEFAIDLVTSFPLTYILDTCIHLLRYVRQLQQESPTMTAATCGNLQNAENSERALFDLKTHSPKQLRHYTYVIMQFLSSISSAQSFLQIISKLTVAENATVKPFYQTLIIQILSFVPQVNLAIEQSTETLIIKFWKVILHNLHSILHHVICLLSDDTFLIVVNGLLSHQLPSIRSKMLELLITKLQHGETFVAGCNETNLSNLLKALICIVSDILNTEQSAELKTSNEIANVQQAALSALKLLSRFMSLNFLADFKALLIQMIRLLKKRKKLTKQLPGSVYLTTIELSCNLKAHCLQQLPKFMPLVIEVMQEQTEHLKQHAADQTTVTCVTGLQKLLHSLPLFLSPYLVNIMIILSTLHTRLYAHVNENTQTQLAKQKLTQIWSLMAKSVPARVLIPNCEKTFTQLMSNQNYSEVPIIMQMLRDSINNSTTADLATLQTELSQLFLQTLSFRLQLSDSNLSSEQINSYELPMLDALVAWVLKLSESYFRIYYQRIHKWAFKDVAKAETKLTYFMFTYKLSEALKSLFVLFANDFIDDAASIMKQHDDTAIDAQLLQAIIMVLYNVFLHDNKAFINAQRFNTLMQPLVDQLEEPLLISQTEVQQLLSKCLCQLALVAPNDVQRKDLVYQVLLKTRCNNAQTQIWAFNCCVDIASALGEDFRALLPEAIPFIAELFEDDDVQVEQSVRKAVQKLELILGESLQKYL